MLGSTCDISRAKKRSALAHWRWRLMNKVREQGLLRSDCCRSWARLRRQLWCQKQTSSRGRKSTTLRGIDVQELHDFRSKKALPACTAATAIGAMAVLFFCAIRWWRRPSAGLRGAR
jgi:hypothetical protein